MPKEAQIMVSFKSCNSFRGPYIKVWTEKDEKEGKTHTTRCVLANSGSLVLGGLHQAITNQPPPPFIELAIANAEDAIEELEALIRVCQSAILYIKGNCEPERIVVNVK